MATGKYRDTQEYFRVFAELIRVAECRGLTTYQNVAVIMGLPLQGQHMGIETGRVLGDISEDEVNSGRPMLSAIAVSVNGTPGNGFYDLAKKLNRMKSGDNERTFWERERDAVYKTWQRPLPKDPVFK